MKMRKLVSSALIAAVVTSLVLAGCGNKSANTNETKTSTNTNISEPGKFPVVKDKITLNIGIPAPTDPTVKMDENWFTKQVEEKTNIDIKWTEITSSSFKEKVNLMFASGDMPDMISTGAGTTNRFSKTEEAQFGSQGLIIPLNDLIKKHGFYINEVFKQQKELEKYITTPDGNIYALPNVDDGYHVTYPQKMWINTTWLKNLNLEMPKTTDDFYKVMKAFKENDPNKNGKKDEIPLSTVKSGSNVQLDGFLMMPFEYTPTGDRLWVNNGKVTLSPAESGYKEGLKYLNKLYKEGLIYKEAFTQDQKSQVNLNEGGDAPVIGAEPSMHMGYVANLTASTRWQQYDSVPPLAGPSGKAISMYDPYTTKYTTGFLTITKNCKNPEAAFKLADYMYSEEATIGSRSGRDSKEYSKAETGAKGLDGRQAKWTSIKVDTKNPEFQNIKWDQVFPANGSFDYQMSWSYPENPYDPKVDPMIGRMKVFYNATKVQEKVGQKAENVLPDLYYKQDAITEMSQLKTTINDYINESVVRFITGNMDIDKDWDSYLSQLDKLGLKRYLQIAQDAYDAQYKKK